MISTHTHGAAGYAKAARNAFYGAQKEASNGFGGRAVKFAIQARFAARDAERAAIRAAMENETPAGYAASEARSAEGYADAAHRCASKAKEEQPTGKN